MNFEISKLAGIDLEKIWVYTFETWSEEQAVRYIKQIMEEIRFIASKPETGTDYSFLRKGYFRTKVKSHFIFYTISKKNNSIEIIRILHQHMDIENRLK